MKYLMIIFFIYLFTVVGLVIEDFKNITIAKLMKGGGGVTSQRIPNSVPYKIKGVQNTSTVIRRTKEKKLKREPESGTHNLG